jgi:hypothetical protein
LGHLAIYVVHDAKLQLCFYIASDVSLFLQKIKSVTLKQENTLSREMEMLQK